MICDGMVEGMDLDESNEPASHRDTNPHYALCTLVLLCSIVNHFSETPSHKDTIDERKIEHFRI